MKTETIRFDTKKSLAELAQEIQNFTSSEKRASIEKIQNNNPFGDILQDSKADIEVMVYSHRVILGTGEYWGVQVFVTDKGNYRSVELVALGNSFGEYYSMQNSYEDPFNFTLGKRKMRALAERLK